MCEIFLIFLISLLENILKGNLSIFVPEGYKLEIEKI